MADRAQIQKTDVNLQSSDLSEDQEHAYQRVCEWANSPNGQPILTLGGFAGCLSGNTIIQYCRGMRNGVRSLTLRDLYLKFNGFKVPGVRGIGNRWVDLTVPTFLYSLWPDQTVELNKIVGVLESGVKSVIRIDFDKDRHLICTPDHPIAIPGGEFVEASDLIEGSHALARSTRRLEEGKGRQLDQRPPRIIVNTKYHPPGAPKIVVCNGIEYEYVRVPRARLVIEAAMNNMPYDEFVHCLKHNAGLSAQFKYLPSNVDVHHEDENTLNDDIDNLKVLPGGEHARLHTIERNKELDRPEEATVIRISEAVDEMTYDIQMASPANNFAANGIFVHNTGKTTVLSVFARESKLEPIAFVAFTGKATSVLRRKLSACGVQTTTETRKLEDGDYVGPPENWGMPYCGTIHSLIYIPIEDPETGRIVAWKDRVTLDRKYKLIIVDESSMVTDDMLEKLRAFDVPILAVGDHGQLAPVRGLGSLMDDPDVRLEKIHRQAADNPIIRLSKVVRETGRLDEKLADGKFITFGRKSNMNRYISDRYRNADLDRLFELGMICYMNRTRVGLNVTARAAQGFKGPPNVGEQIICLKNMKEEGIYNGMRGVIETSPQFSKQHPWKFTSDLHFPEDDIAATVTMFAPQFNRDKTFDGFDSIKEERGIVAKTWSDIGQLFDFGSALTCHKSQGSSFQDLLLIVERPGPVGEADFRRWIYTAITRASEKITILI